MRRCPWGFKGPKRLRFLATICFHVPVRVRFLATISKRPQDFDAGLGILAPNLIFDFGFGTSTTHHVEPWRAVCPAPASVRLGCQSGSSGSLISTHFQTWRQIDSSVSPTLP